MTNKKLNNRKFFTIRGYIDDHIGCNDAGAFIQFDTIDCIEYCLIIPSNLLDAIKALPPICFMEVDAQIDGDAVVMRDFRLSHDIGVEPKRNSTCFLCGSENICIQDEYGALCADCLDGWNS